jgi:hypothetical protein
MRIPKTLFLLVAPLVVLCLLIAGNLPVQAAPVAQLTPFFTPTPGADGRIIYVVQDGDTLWRISAITGVSLDDLRTLNKLGLNDTIASGDRLLIGLGGPAFEAATPGPSPTPLPATPTSTALIGTANLCVRLFNDENGDMIAQEDELDIPDGAISVSNRTGTLNESATTKTGAEPVWECFEELAEGEYTVSAGIPDGYNPTTVLDRVLALHGGDQIYISFGAQPNSEQVVETVVIPETPNRSPMLAIIGAVILLIGIALGIYASLLRRAR